MSSNPQGEILGRIADLVAEERGLRQQSEHRLTPEERQRMRQLERDLDQCWDRLRQRRAREEYGRGPHGDTLGARPASRVENDRQ